jgi:hypothetical protein
VLEGPVLGLRLAAAAEHLPLLHQHMLLLLLLLLL